jgi:hypothetical protein
LVFFKQLLTFFIARLRPGMAALRIEFDTKPSGSRNLEFDPAKQIQ